MALAAVALGFGWPSTRGELSKRRLLGLALVAGVLSIFVVTNWSDLSQLQSADPEAQISGGAGLYLYTAGVVAMWVCVVRAFRARRRR
jgi:flagellar biosynthesis protein FlhB